MKLNIMLFGGRGASSGGAKMSLPKARKKLEELGNKMGKLSREYSASFSRENPDGDSKIQQQYFKVQKEYNKLRDKINDEEDKRRKSTTTQTTRTFINSFGEATTRNITSSTYERAKRRNEKAVRRNLGL